MSGSERLAAMLRAGPLRWSTLALSGREWRDGERFLKAFRRAIPDGGVTVSATLSDPEHSNSAETEAPWRLWLSRPSRARAEFALGEEVLTVVVEGDQWWSWSPSLGPRTGATGVQVGLGPGFLLADARRVLSRFDDYSVEGTTRVGGRDGVVLRMRPAAVGGDVDEGHADEWPVVASDGVLSELGGGADDYELVVNTELGVLLRVEARLDAQPFRSCEVSELTVDEPASMELFTLSPADGKEFEVVRPHQVH